MKKLILFALSAALLLSGCASSEKTGNFQLYLTDQPVDADEIWATISKIEVQKTGEAFLTIWEGTKEYDLLTLMNTQELVLDTTLEEGMYTQIRLTVTEGRIVIGGQSNEMTVPSSMVQIPLVFNVMEDSSVEVVLDFEADQSVDVIHTGQNAEYLLKPVIRVENISY
ncbi:MAG: DUF4382 domain-containing protein [Candidatus Aminicenantes bacterium]|nr:DUF4382 domain-containing protein [Candidatus Aminicenantes bacterium]